MFTHIIHKTETLVGQEKQKRNGTAVNALPGKSPRMSYWSHVPKVGQPWFRGTEEDHKYFCQYNLYPSRPPQRASLSQLLLEPYLLKIGALLGAAEGTWSA